MPEAALRNEDRTMRERSAGKMHAFKEGEHVLALYDGPLPIPNDAHEDEAFDPAATLLKARVRRLCRADVISSFPGLGGNCPNGFLENCSPSVKQGFVHPSEKKRPILRWGRAQIWWQPRLR